MEHGTKDRQRAHQAEASSLGELIHAHVRAAVEHAVREELAAVLGAGRYERREARYGYRNGHKTRTLTGPTGPLALTLPRATLFSSTGPKEWASSMVPRYQRRLREVNTAVAMTYLAGANTRRLKGALQPLLKAAPLSRSAVSRIVGTLKGALFVDGLVARDLRAPLLCIIDGNAGLRRAVERGWPRAAVQRCCVHKLRNLQSKAPAHARAEVTADFHRIVYAEKGGAELLTV